MEIWKWHHVIAWLRIENLKIRKFEGFVISHASAMSACMVPGPEGWRKPPPARKNWEIVDS
jgi:hypothetical protein